MEITLLPRPLRVRARRLIGKPGFQLKFSKDFFDALKQAEKNGRLEQAGAAILELFEARWRNDNAADRLHSKLQSIKPQHTIFHRTSFGAHLKITCLRKDESSYRVRLNNLVTVYLNADNLNQSKTLWTSSQKHLELCLYLGDFVGSAEFVVDLRKNRVAITEKEAFAVLSKNGGLSIGHSEHYFKKWLLANRLAHLKRGQKITRKLGKTMTLITKTGNHLELQTTTGLKIRIELATRRGGNRLGYLRNSLADLAAKRNQELYAVVGEAFATNENPLTTLAYRCPTKFFVDQHEVPQKAFAFLDECLAKNRSPSIEVLLEERKQ